MSQLGDVFFVRVWWTADVLRSEGQVALAPRPDAYRITHEAEWLEHASREGHLSSAVKPRPRLGLHQGELGIAYLAERLASPRAYPFPALGASSV